MYKSKTQKKIVRAMRSSQLNQGAVLSEVIPIKVLGITYPGWVCDYQTGKQKIYAINVAGYDCYISSVSY